MRRHPRKTTPKVRDGRVQKKNRHDLTPNYWNTPQDRFVIDRERPGRGYRHLLRKADVERFIELLPEWDELSIGLDAIVLAAGEWNLDGWYAQGIVGICAWDRDLWIESSVQSFTEHRPILERLGVDATRKSDYYLVKWTEEQARAYQLLHIFLHELGHHHDAITNRSNRTARGESYAETYALKHSDAIWHCYMREFAG